MRASLLPHLKINIKVRIREGAAREIVRGTVRPDYALYWYNETFAHNHNWRRLFKASNRPGRVELRHK